MVRRPRWQAGGVGPKLGRAAVARKLGVGGDEGVGVAVVSARPVRERDGILHGRARLGVLGGHALWVLGHAVQVLGAPRLHELGVVPLVGPRAVLEGGAVAAIGAIRAEVAKRGRVVVVVVRVAAVVAFAVVRERFGRIKVPDARRPLARVGAGAAGAPVGAPRLQPALAAALDHRGVQRPLQDRLDDRQRADVLADGHAGRDQRAEGVGVQRLLERRVDGEGGAAHVGDAQRARRATDEQVRLAVSHADGRGLLGLEVDVRRRVRHHLRHAHHHTASAARPS